VALVAVAKSSKGEEKFRKYWAEPLPIYVDVEKKIIPIINGSQQGLLSGAWNYFSGGSVSTNWKRGDQYGIQGDTKGEGLKLGGLGVFNAGGEVVFLVSVFFFRRYLTMCDRPSA